jgi:hypothetical protein
VRKIDEKRMVDGFLNKVETTHNAPSTAVHCSVFDPFSHHFLSEQKLP